MSKHLIKGFVYHVQYDFSPETFHVHWHDSGKIGQADPDWVLVGPHDFEVEVPDEFDPRPAKITALEAKKQAIRAEFAKNVRDIDEQIQKLLCIENGVAA